jgi:hypothetical protein
MPQLDKEVRKEYNRQIYLKRKQKPQVNQNITATIEKVPPTIMHISTQTNIIIPDEKKYIDALRSMLIPSNKFVSLIPCVEDERGRPIFFYVNKYPDEDRTEISIVKLRYLKCGDGILIYLPDWETVEEISNIHDSNLHQIIAFDTSRTYEGGSYLQWRNKFKHFIKA